MLNKKLVLQRLLLIAFIIFFGFDMLSAQVKKPEDNRFTKVVLVQKLEEPIQFDILPDGRVIYAERKGKLKVYDPKTQQVKLVADIPVSTKYVSKTGEVTEGEDGLQGVILDPDYAKNNWIYLYYSPKDGDPKNILVRYEWKGDKLIESSRKVLLDVVVQREECCHVGGGMLFDKAGNLYLSTGDNTFSRSSDGFTPIDERPGAAPRDAQKSSGNTNDLRGKILRIHPEKDGTYTIPEGNLFPPGTPLTRPEIYTMGNRNPWRLTIDSKTGWLYWGEVGPDGSNDGEFRGPKAYDEFNMAKKAGNYGWPYFVADNKAYWDYDFETKKSGEKFNPALPVNNSPNNTGMKTLPPTTPAIIWYPYANSPEFPELQTGGRSATGGPIYHRADFKNPSRPYPEYYEGKWFITDWVRGWIMAVTLNDTGGYKSMEHFLPDLKLRGPIDMKFGPDGSLYVLEYGNGYFKDNPEAELIKIEYNGGNRKPVVQAVASKTAGAVPFKVSLSSAGTTDYDEGDSLKYRWTITKAGSKTARFFNTADAATTITVPGEYKATLTVTDAKGARNSKSVTLMAGNEPPQVNIQFNAANRSFYFPGKSINYDVKVTDREDGSLLNKKISPAQVAVSIDYLSEGFDLTEIAQSQRSVDVSVLHARAVNMINKSDCRACHAITTKSLGPSFTAIAKKYTATDAIVTRLSRKIINGGSGVWGDAMMPAHSSLSENDAKAMVNYILSLGNKNKTVKSKPVKGNYMVTLPASDNGRGSYIFRAAYTDRGTKTSAPQSAEHMIVLRNPTVPVANADTISDVGFRGGRSAAVIGKNGAFIGFKHIDLTGIKQVELLSSGADTQIRGIEIELRAGSPSGKLIGSSKNSTVPVTDEAGMGDIYFVFRRPDNDQAAIQVRAFRFVQ